LLRAGPWPGIMSTPMVPPVGTRAQFPPVKPGTRPTRPGRAQGRRSGADKPSREAGESRDGFSAIRAPEQSRQADRRTLRCLRRPSRVPCPGRLRGREVL